MISLFASAFMMSSEVISQRKNETSSKLELKIEADSDHSSICKGHSDVKEESSIKGGKKIKKGRKKLTAAEAEEMLGHGNFIRYRKRRSGSKCYAKDSEKSHNKQC
ncbi:hypothetical protein SAMN04489761_1828 [Tenacibaculum sp. MAR_2009_124]|nr:hypothetical protein SAMN04489761_1828 [Tenacibaculum sp. MAR_2009_124]